MDCLRSFSFRVSANTSESYPQIDTWGAAPENYWLYSSTLASSTFNVQGFKNINVYKIEAVGDISCLPNTSASVLVNDWEFYVKINGQNASIPGYITSSPNGFIMTTVPENPTVSLSKFNTKIEFLTPVQSVLSIQILKLNARGIGAENLSLVNISWHMTFIVYYNFEGE
jgi:hypothetical protein